MLVQSNARYNTQKSRAPSPLPSACGRTYLGHEADVGRDDGAAVPGEDERLPQGHVLMLRCGLYVSLAYVVRFWYWCSFLRCAYLRRHQVGDHHRARAAHPLLAEDQAGPPSPPGLLCDLGGRGVWVSLAGRTNRSRPHPGRYVLN